MNREVLKQIMAPLKYSDKLYELANKEQKD